MSIKTYYRWALVLPLLVPALASPLLLMRPLPGVLGAVMLYLVWSVLIGGVPYLLFATGFLLWMRRVPEERVRTGILLSPVAYTACLVVCLTLFLAVDGTLANSSESLGIFSVFGLLFGYAYVALAEVGRVLLRPGAARVEPVASA